MKKKVVVGITLLVLAAGAGGGYWYYINQDSEAVTEDAVFVDSVGMITGLTNAGGRLNQFVGVVEPQKTEKIEAASGLKVKKNYVSVGDEVQVGTKLFEYDTDEAQDSITQLEIDIENADITIESTKAQIEQLEKERDKVSDDEKLSYTTQIMTAENSIKRTEYEKKSKQAEMEGLKKQIANSVVTSPIQGVVKTITSTDPSSTSGMDYSSDTDSSAYMTIMATGDYRIKGTVNEQNISQLSEGDPVIVHSRVDESIIWRGTITSIDRENPKTNQSSSYYYDSSDTSETTSSNYTFYVDMDSSDGLMLGQHVYLVLDMGQEDEKDGMWLEDYYFITDENGMFTEYVWAADSKDRLEKRKVTLGDFDEDSYRYQILDGLTVDDYIAFPTEDLKEGMPVTKNLEQLDSDLMMDDNYYFGDDEYYDEGDYEEEYFDEYDFSEDDFAEDDFSDGDFIELE
ncbi:MAG: efflux RND transporter periplasmic adaptor subunit [Muricoprocola sp.]